MNQSSTNCRTRLDGAGAGADEGGAGAGAGGAGAGGADEGVAGAGVDDAGAGAVACFRLSLLLVLFDDRSVTDSCVASLCQAVLN